MAAFTFNVSDLTTGVTPSNQWEWHAPCVAEFPADPAQISETTKRWNADLSVGPISECVRFYFIRHGDDDWHKRLSTAEADGTGDAMVVEIAPGKETL